MAFSTTVAAHVDLVPVPKADGEPGFATCLGSACTEAFTEEAFGVSVHIKVSFGDIDGLTGTEEIY